MKEIICMYFYKDLKINLQSEKVWYKGELLPEDACKDFFEILHAPIEFNLSN